MYLKRGVLKTQSPRYSGKVCEKLKSLQYKGIVKLKFPVKGKFVKMQSPHYIGKVCKNSKSSIYGKTRKNKVSNTEENRKN
eukprot:UN09578